ncbi:hypothetical protein MY4038_007162 [Beauveria bassiana]
MSSMTQEQLDNIAWLEQERRRIKNEEIETARRSTELSIQRCQTELGITDPTITSTIASEVLRAEEAERLQVAAVRLYSREIQRLLIYGKLPIETEIEVGTLLIEHARYYFGARLFRTECSPLNVRYTDIMQALGLRRFHTVEPASFNPALAAATWKFDLWSWKAAEEELKRQGQWFVNKDTMQEDPEAERWPIHEDPEEPLPSLAIVQAVPTVREDPAAFEAIRQPTHSAQSHSGPVLWPQASESIDWPSGSYLTGNTGTTDTGTSSGLGYSESDQTQSSSSTFQSRSPTGSSSESLASITLQFAPSRAFGKVRLL